MFEPSLSLRAVFSRLIVLKLVGFYSLGILAAHGLHITNVLFYSETMKHSYTADSRCSGVYFIFFSLTVDVIVPPTALECVNLLNKCKPLLLVGFIG